MRENDELTKLMSAIDPAVTPADAELAPGQRAIRENIKEGTLRSAPVSLAMRGRRPTVAAVLVAAVLVLAVAIVPLFFRSPQVVAFTPPPLQYTDIDLTAAELLDFAGEKLRDPDAPGRLPMASPHDPDNPDGPVRGSYSVGWYPDATDLGTEKARIAITPQVTTVTWSEDLSGHVLITAGESYVADGSDEFVDDPDVPAAGSVLSDEHYAPGEFSVPDVEAPVDTKAGVLRALHAYGLTPMASGADMISEVSTLFSVWTLTDSHHAALLENVLSEDDVVVIGTTSDRQGRDVIGIAADSDRGFREILLISSKTGRIVGAETTRTTELDGIPEGAVISYTFWKDTQE